MTTKKAKQEPISAEQLHAEDCPKGGKHTIWWGMTGDTKPQFCSKCGTWTDEFPPDDGEEM